MSEFPTFPNPGAPGAPSAPSVPSVPSIVSAGRDVISVSELNRAIGSLLERNFPLAWIRGEISNFTRAASGHWYFSLKDKQAQIRCVMFRGRNQHVDFTPREGEAVEVRALVSMYEPRGELQLSVESIRKAGLGNLYEAFLRLKAMLAEQGLFDAERKRPLPAQPAAIGVITSLQAAALRDVLTTLSRRAPHVPVVVYPVPVQGAGAAEKIAAMVALANRRREVDVLILCRGGGSIEDLWSFNEEVVAQAVFRSELPVVAGVGHETDTTIVDFVADVRAPTPTAAAELASPDRARMLRDVANGWAALGNGMHRALDRRAQATDWLARRLRSPQAQLRERQIALAATVRHMAQAMQRQLTEQRHRHRVLAMHLVTRQPDAAQYRRVLEQHGERLARAMLRVQERAQQRVQRNVAALELLNPQRTLERGYAVLLTREGKAVRAPSELRARMRIEARLAQGSADIEIANVQAKLLE
jgi:exodeoxyribonuclease VII large subunit